ncbi:MAG: T9SS type A sorting domain-containing protein [Bacteroidota bacterium]
MNLIICFQQLFSTTRLSWFFNLIFCGCLALPQLVMAQGHSDCSLRDNYEQIPLMHITVAYHFVANEQGDNFQCQSPSNDLYVPPIIESILTIANRYFADPPLNQTSGAGKVTDARFRWPTEFDCDMAFFYPNGTAPNQVNLVDGALNIYFQNNGRGFVGGSGGIPLRIFNLLEMVQTGSFAAEEYARLLNHEFGHNHGLPHSFSEFNDCDDLDCALECGGPEQDCNIQDCPSDLSFCHPSFGGRDQLCCYCTITSSNNFMGYGQPQNAMTPCQWEEMMRNIFASPRDYFSWCKDEEEPLEITKGQRIHWTSYKMLNRHIIVRRGASLTISCEVRLGPGKRITVERGAKLLILGGLVTRLCPQEGWGGIYVEGNGLLPQATPNDDPNDLPASNQSGIVYLAGATLEHAPTAITTARHNDFGNPKLWGGVVCARNSIFRDNRRAVAFMKYLHPNNSRFIDCEFHRGFGAVSIWACRGIQFQQNFFWQQSQYGIRGIDYQSEIFDFNQFFNCEHGVEVFSSFPSASKVFIGYDGSSQNEFSCGNNRENSSVAIVVENSDVFIKNNVIRGYTMGAVYRGPSNYVIDNNLFEEQRVIQNTNALSLWETGQSGVSDIRCNFIFTDQGIDAIDDNKALLFVGNTFDTRISDVLVREDVLRRGAGVKLNQGSRIEPANNCFTPGEERDHILTSSNSVDKFEYFFTGAVNPNCQLEPYQPRPGSFRYRYEKIEISINHDPCKKEGGFNISKAQLHALQDSIQLLESQWQQQPTDSSLLLAIEDTRISRNILLGEWARQTFREGHQEEVADLLEKEANSKALKILFGLWMEQQAYDKAEKVLNTLPSEEADFVRLQTHNLHFLQAVNGLYRPETEEMDWIRQLAEVLSENRGYARALLAIWEGAYFEYSFEPYPLAQERRGQQPLSSGKLQCFPNPAKGQLQLSLPKQLQTGQIRIYNSKGELQTQLNIPASDQPSHQTLDISQWPNGLYFLQFDINGIHKERHKILVLK